MFVMLCDPGPDRRMEDVGGDRALTREDRLCMLERVILHRCRGGSGGEG
jgi:hypothetical protein